MCEVLIVFAFVAGGGGGVTAEGVEGSEGGRLRSVNYDLQTCASTTVAASTATHCNALQHTATQTCASTTVAASTATRVPYSEAQGRGGGREGGYAVSSQLLTSRVLLTATHATVTATDLTATDLTATDLTATDLTATHKPMNAAASSGSAALAANATTTATPTPTATATATATATIYATASTATATSQNQPDPSRQADLLQTQNQTKMVPVGTLSKVLPSAALAPGGDVTELGAFDRSSSAGVFHDIYIHI